MLDILKPWEIDLNEDRLPQDTQPAEMSSVRVALI